MNKRNRLQVNTPDNSFNFTQTDSIILNPKLSTDHAPQNPETFYEDTEYTPAPAETAGRYKTRSPFAKALCVFLRIKAYLLHAVLLSIIFYLLCRPSEYSLLLDDIYSLREENLAIKCKLGPKNICLVTEGAHVEATAPLYRFGFFRSASCSPNSIMEPMAECLSFEGQQGSFVVKLGHAARLSRIGVYHPPSGSRTSAIKDFAVTIGGREYRFIYKGHGYEEFAVDGHSEAVAFRIIDNYGEKRYTSIYRIYVFGE